MMLLRIWYAAALLLLSLAGPRLARADYALRDGDTVVFLGDSITAARTYGKIVENYTLLRFPGRKVRFINSGWGGDTAQGGLKRLERDVFDLGATVLIVAYGINDIGWGTKADAEHKAAYLDAVRGIVEECRRRKVRVFLCSAAITAADPDKSENDFLQRMCDEGMALSRSLGEGAIDVQRTMRGIQRKVLAWNVQLKEGQAKESLHAPDGVHLSDLGQLAMAFAILKGLGAPAEVSSVAIDSRGPTLIEAKGCRASGLSSKDGRLEFVRDDDGLPINFGVFGALQFRFVPVPDELNRYDLVVLDLPPVRFEVEADGRGLGVFSSEQLARGVNVASATADGWEPGGPWDAQAALLKQVTDARSEIANARRLAGHYLPRSPSLPGLESESRAVDAEIVALQRTIAKPTPYHFVVRPARPPLEKGELEAFDELLRLMRERLALMHDVARTKWNTKRPITDPRREQVSLDAIEKKGAAAGLDPGWTRSFFKAQVEAAKRVQEADFRAWEAERRGPFPDAHDLERDLRPQIDALGTALIAALTKARPWLCSSERRGVWNARARDVLEKDGLDVLLRDTALEPLMAPPPGCR